MKKHPLRRPKRVPRRRASPDFQASRQHVPVSELLARLAQHELILARAKHRKPADSWLRSMERITARGWGHAMRYAILTVALPVAGILALAEVDLAVCATAALILGHLTGRTQRLRLPLTTQMI